MEKIKTGIVGCGRIFPMHAVSITKQENVELVSVCDIKEKKAQKRAKEFNCKAYLDYSEMMDQEDLDVIHICTPHNLHPVIAVQAAEKGINILTEKPMAIKEENARKMISTARDNDVTLGVIFQNRYNPGSVVIKENLENGALGEIQSAKLSVTWQRTDEYYSGIDWKGTWDQEGGGVIIDQAIHTLDLMRWFMDSKVKAVDCDIDTRKHEYIDVEDVAEGIIEFENDSIASFYTMNYYTYDAPVEIELHCENGIAEIKGETGTVKLDNGKVIKAQRDPNETFDYGEVESYWGVSHKKQISNYYDSLKKGQKPEITGEEAFKTQQMVCAMYESGKKEKVIKVNN
ncbi:MAG: Gfo/Idh/MocA family protein [Bacillota bacterium]